jgi:hypothetical protein
MRTFTNAAAALALVVTLSSCNAAQVTDVASDAVDAASRAAAMAAAEAVARTANAAAEAAGAPGGIVTPKHVIAAASAATSLGASVEAGQDGVSVTYRGATVYVCAMRDATVSIVPCPHAAP